MPQFGTPCVFLYKTLLPLTVAKFPIEKSLHKMCEFTRKKVHKMCEFARKKVYKM